MARQHVRACAAAALLGLLALGLGGCWNPFAPPRDDPPDDPPDWQLRDSPQHVLDNLLTAYEHKAADEYLDCLAEDFTFWLNPVEVEENPELEPGYWGKAEERAIHYQMFGEGRAEPLDPADRITLTLSLVGEPQPFEPIPGDIHWDYREAVDLRVYVGVTTYWATAPSKYVFRIDRDQVGPNGETLWEIVSWHDLPAGTREAVATDQGYERISFGRLKAMYRP